MPHVAFLSFSGLRVRDEWLAEFGVQLPGLRSRGSAIAQLPSLGLQTLAGTLPDDWTCSYREVQEPSEGLVETIVDERPTVVAMSSLTASVQQAYKLSGQLRARSICTVLGGLHATACPAEAAEYFDAVCCGEGELIWPRVVADILDGELQRCYSAVRTAAQFDWPIPRIDLLADRTVARWTVQTQRGCPLACEFCAASRLLSRFREKPVDRIRQELAAIKQLDPTPLVELADDNTFAGSRDPELLLSTLADANVRYFTETDWRIGERPELVRDLAASGCVQVLVGIESFVFRYPGMGSKEAALERILAAIDRIQDAGVAVIGCFIVGADGETQSSLTRLTRFLCSTQMADVQVTLQTAFPGTASRMRLASEGRLLDRDWSHYTLFDVTHQPDQMSVEELESGYRRLLSDVFCDEQAVRRARLRREIWRCNPVLRGQPWTA